MFRTCFYVLLLFVVLVNSFSCNNENPVEVESTQDWRPFDTPPPSMNTLSKPGIVHNEILDAFNARHSLTTGKEIKLVDFVQFITESVNEVMALKNESTRVKKEDVTLVLRLITILSRKDIYDFYGETASDPQKLIDFLEEHGKIQNNDATSLKKAMALLPAVTAPMGSADESEFLMAADQSDTWLLTMSSDILQHSKEYWLKINAQCFLRDDRERKRDRPRQVTSKEAGGYISDVMGGLVGYYMLGGVGAIVTGPLSSLVFHMGLDGLNGALESLDEGDYYWPADWWDDAC